MISVRGNWPLVPTMDVVVPHTRTIADLLEVLDIIVADDPDPRGDLWRLQPWVPIPAPSAHRPPPTRRLPRGHPQRQAHRRAAMYINADPLAGTAKAPGIGGPPASAS